MGYSSSLQDWIDEERKRKEAEALAKQKAADAARRAALAQAANLPQQGPTMAGPSLAQAPQQGPTMAGPSLAQSQQPPAPAFDTSALSAQQPITATPQPIAPKPAPISVSTKIAKPAAPTFMDLSPELAQPDAPLQQSPMQGPQRPVDDPNDPIHNALNRWRTSDQPDILGQLTKYQIQPYKPPQLDNGFGGTGAVDLGATGTIGGNTIPTAGTMGTMPGTQPGQTLPGGAQPNQWINLDSWKPQQGPTQSGNWLNDTVNSAVKPFSSGNPNEFVQNWLATTPGGQEVKANMDKRWQNQNQMNGGQYLWNNALDAMDVVSTGPRRFIEDTQIPGLNLSAGQALSAAGQGINRAINPLSANYQKDAGTGPAYKSVVDFSKQNLPSSVAGAVAPFLPLANVWDNVSSNIAKAQAVNNYVKSLPSDQQNKVQIALTNIASGPESTQKTITDILNQNQTAATYTQQAQAALAKSQDMTLPPEQRNQAALQAAQLGKQANDEKNYSALDYVDKNRNPWADLAMSLVTDPIQYLPIDKAFEGYKAWKTAKIFDVSPEEAMSVLPKALEDAQKILGKVVTQDATKLVDAGAPKLAPLAATGWEKINPLALTPETKAQQATTKLWNAASNLIGNVSSKEDARLLIQTWIDNPTKLIEGLTGLTSPTAKAVSDQGALKVGAGVIANKPLLEVMPILQGARDALTKLESLAGEGAFNPAHLASELDNVFYDSARQMYGMDGLAVPQGLSAATKKAYDLAKDANIASGSVKPVLRRLSDGTGVIDFVATGANQAGKAAYDLTAKSGKIIASSTPEVFANAEASFKALMEAGKTGAGSGIAKTAATAWGLQRAILSDMYLTLNPGHWVRNAASATATLLTDGNYAIRNQKEMIGELESKLGMIPNRELQGAVSGMAEKLPHWTERFAPGNPYAKLVNAANDIWGGLTTLGGSVPFGEESFRLTGFHTAFQRSFKQAWKAPVEGEFKAGLQALGVDPALAKTITQHVIDAGIGGSKADIANTAREVLSGQTIRQGLREIGVPDELLSMGGWGKLKDVLGGHLPEQADEATNAVRQIFTEEMVAKGQILNDAPPQMGNYKWSEIELAHDNAALIDHLREAGKQAGIDPQKIEQTVRDIAPKLEQSMSGTWDKFRADLAQAPNPGEALNHALDTWARHSEMKQAARAGVDELSRNAVSAGTPTAWADKWQGTQQIYQKLMDDTGALFDGARARMNGVSQAPGQTYDWWKAIERYTNYDEAAVNEARTAGMGLGQATTDSAQQFTQSISAGREYLDKHTLELYDAFRRNPTQESLDMLVNAQHHVDHMGAQAASYLKDQRDLAMDGKLAWEKYHQIRNQTWGQYFDNAVIHNKATQRYIVADGVTSKFKEALSWDDPFYGQMRVIAPDAAEAGTTAPARYMVMGPDGKMQSVGASYVPNEVKEAFNRIINHDEVVDSVMADIAKTAPTPAPRAPAQASAGSTRVITGDELRKLAEQGAGENFKSQLSPASEYASKQIDEALKNGSTVNMYVDGKKVNVTSTKGGMAIDAQGQQWGFLPVAMGTPGERNEIEIIARAGAAPTPIDAKAIIDAQGGRTATELADAKQADKLRKNKPIFAGDVRLRFEDGQDQLLYVAGGSPSNKVAQQARTQLWNSGEYKTFDDVKQAAADVRERVKGIKGKARNVGEWRGITQYGPGGSDIVDIPSSVGAGAVESIAKPRPLEGNAIQEKIGQAQSSGRELASARDTMKTQWDREVSAHWKLPSLDNLLARYERKGVVNVPENMFEDIYGTTIAGHRINGQADVESLLSEYAQVKRQAGQASKMAEEGAASIADLHSVARSAGVNTLTGAGSPSDQYLLNAVNAERKAQKMKALTLEQLQRDPAMREQAAELLMNKIGPEGGPTIHAADWDPHKLEAGETVEKVLADNTTKSKAINGMKAPEMGEVLGSHMIEQLQAAERKIIDQLPGILSGKPNQLTEAQRLGAMDLLNKILPHFDNAVATASKGATDATDFAMLNFTNRRNFDSILGMVFPYHYFWTRSAANWAQRVMAKPGVLLKYYNLQKAIELENQQQNLPARLQGTIPNPVNQFGVGPERLGNPMTWILPFSSYTGSSYGRNPDDAGSEYEKWLLSVQKFTPGLMPALQAIQNATLDQVSPLPGGEKRFKASDYAPQKFIPAIDLGGYAVQALTGRPAAQLPNGMGPTFGDQFDPYRAGRKLAEMAQAKEIDPATAQYAQQMLLNQQNGKPATDKIPVEYQAQAAQALLDANKGAARDRLWAKAGTFLTGNAGYTYSPEEQKLQETTQTAPKLGYNEWSNPFGSKQAMTDYKAQQPALGPYQTKSALVPSTDATYQPMEPAVSAQNTAKNSAKDAIQADMSKATEQYLQQHPEATSKEVMALKQPYLDKIKALDAQYPDAGYPEGNGNVPRGLNPQERAQWQLDQIIYGSAAGSPQKPPDGATPEQLQAYYKAKADFVQKQLDSIESGANNAFADQGEPDQAWRQAFKDLTKGKYAIDLLHDAYLKDASQTEKDWSLRNELKQELTSAQFAQANEGLEQRMGKDTAALWQQYTQLPKDGTARADFKKAHPELSLASIAAYNPDQYDAAVKQFGPNAWKVYSGKPEYPGATATPAQLATYKAQMQAYEKANPQYSAIKLWVDGRPRKFEEAPTGMIAQRNFGQDYSQAMKIFGPKILSVVANYPSNADSKTKALYYKAHPELSGYYQWYNEVKDQPPTYTPLNQDTGGISPNLANYSGPRPIGSDRQPIGQPPGAAPIKSQWDLGALGFPSGGQTAGAPAPTSGGKTAKDYIAESDKDYQEKFYKEHGYRPGKSPKYLKWLESQAAYKQRRAGVATEFGEEGAKTWEAYGKLPKGSKARDDYKAAHPELRMYDMAAYNPKEYAAAKQQFGDKAWAEWANVPAYANTPEAQAARQAYFDQHPTAKLMNAWVNGRPTAQGEQGDPSTGFKYNFGADYAAAQKQFGPNIWDLYSQYNTGWDKNKKADFMKKNPQFTQFMNWWYGNSQNGGMGAQRGAYGAGGAFHGYGGGGGGGYSAPHRGQGTALSGIPKVDPMYMNRDLQVSERDLQQLRQWKPHNIDLSWMKAGADIGPENLKKWKR